MFGMKAEIAALEKGVDFELHIVAYSNEQGYEPKHPEVVRINPKQQVPVLVHGDLEIFDSTQIFEYLEDLCPHPPLWPADTQTRARARLLEHLSDEVYFPHIVKLMFLQDDLEGTKAREACAAAADYYRQMEHTLGDRDYLAGDYSYADIAFFMASVFGERMKAPITDQTPNLLQWRDRVTRRPAVSQVITTLRSYLEANKRFIPEFFSEAN